MTQLTDPRTGRVVAGRYELRRVLARGGLGVVFVAWQRDLEREVAVKLLHPALTLDETAVRRFVRETRIASGLNHPHVVPILDAGQDEADVYLVMPLLQGRTLEDLLETGPLPPARVASLMAQVASALAHAHDAGIVHRDLKPSNIFVEATGRSSEVARILDFGVARLSGEGGGTTVTAAGMVSGSPAYMSPEQAAGEEVGPATDLYGLGCTMYQALSGRPPFKADSALAVMRMHLDAEPPALELGADPTSRAMVSLVAELLEKQPERRPPSARAVQARLAELGAASARPAPSPEAAGVWAEPTETGVRVAGVAAEAPARGSRRAFLAVGAGAAVAAGGGWLFWRERTGQSSIVQAATAAPATAAAPAAPAAPAAEAGLRKLPSLKALSGIPGWDVVVDELHRLGAPPFGKLWELKPNSKTPTSGAGRVFTDDFSLLDPPKEDFAAGTNATRVSLRRSLGISGFHREPELRLDFLGGTLYRIYVRLYESVEPKSFETALNGWLEAQTASEWLDTDAGDSLPCKIWRFADVTVVSRVFTNRERISWSALLLVDPTRHPSSRDGASARRN
ncbi:MAG: serine/threonine protein kinase [Deltaproteobacteria bacterium]|nr:serine/threonine protein kinase [Deltaproteobacteria bacterium]